MAVKNLYKSRIYSCKYAFKNGKEANFVDFKYLTDIKSEIEELDYEISLGHPTLYVDPTRKTVDTSKIDPLEDIRKKAVDDYIAQQKNATLMSNDRGTSEPGKLNVATTVNVAAASAGSSSGQAAPAAAPK